MTLKHTIAVGILVFAVLGAPASAGTLDDAVNADARGDYAKALRLIRPAANDGDAAAQFYLGTMYVTGHGVQQDYSAAALWFRKAAEQGYVPRPKLIWGHISRPMAASATRDEKPKQKLAQRLGAGYTTTFSFSKNSSACRKSVPIGNIVRRFEVVA